MARFSPLIALPPLIFLGIGALFMTGLGRENPDQLPSTLEGQPAPAVIVTTLGPNAPFGDAEMQKPEVKLVNFWASWCAPCRAEHPNLETLQNMGIPIYGVNYKDEPEKALRFLAELGNPYSQIGGDEVGRMSIEWGVYGVPETFVIDTSGNVVLRHAGPITQRLLESTILPAIAAAQAK